MNNQENKWKPPVYSHILILSQLDPKKGPYQNITVTKYGRKKSFSISLATKTSVYTYEVLPYTGFHAFIVFIGEF